jgi:hypothetical protein
LREFMKGSQRRIAGPGRGIRDRHGESRKAGWATHGQAGPERRRLMPEALAADAAALVGRLRHDSRLNAESLSRLLAGPVRERRGAVTGEEGGGPPFRLKDPRGIAADSPQGPHDTGAASSGAKWMKGRKLLVAEVSTPAGKIRPMGPRAESRVICQDRRRARERFQCHRRPR